MAKRPKMPPEVLEWFRREGAQGGKARAERHTPEELSKWGKLGGRPKGSKNKKGTK